MIAAYHYLQYYFSGHDNGTRLYNKYQCYNYIVILYYEYHYDYQSDHQDNNNNNNDCNK